MDYFWVLLSVVCFAAQFAFTKMYEQSVRQTATTGFLMLVITGLSGMTIYLCVSGFQVRFSLISTLWAIIMAVIMVPYYILGIQALSAGSVAVYSMFMMLGGMLVPFFYGILFLQETVSLGKLLGTGLLTGFIVLQAAGKEQTSENAGSVKAKRRFFVLCILIFIINGMTGVVTKGHAMSEGAVDEVSFVIVYCAMTAILGLILLTAACLRNRAEKWEQIKTALRRKPFAMMVFIGAAAYTGNFLQLLAADTISASVQFPLVSGGVIVLSAIVSILFRERLSAREWFAVAGTFGATFLFLF